jgi:hypothetical protein
MEKRWSPPGEFAGYSGNLEAEGGRLGGLEVIFPFRALSLGQFAWGMELPLQFLAASL